MTNTLPLTSAVTDVPLQGQPLQTSPLQFSALPLRHDDPISMLLVIKTLVVMSLLLGITYLVLRWYAGRKGQGVAKAESTALTCTSVLRLSPKTKVYLVKSDKTQILITETSTGATALVLPSVATPDAGQPE